MNPSINGVMQKPGEGLLVELDERRVGRPTSGAAVAAQWFAQDLFDGADLDDDDDHQEEVQAAASGKHNKVKQTLKARATAPQDSHLAEQAQQAAPSIPHASAVEAVAHASAGSEDGRDSADQQETSSSEDDEADTLPTAGRAAGGDAQLMHKSGFEEVPVRRRHGGAGSSDESSDDGFDDLDDEGRAEVLALAKKMLKGRERQDIMDNAYHRYAFHETGLPRWFEEDEARHMK